MHAYSSVGVVVRTADESGWSAVVQLTGVVKHTPATLQSTGRAHHTGERLSIKLNYTILIQGNLTNQIAAMSSSLIAARRYVHMCGQRSMLGQTLAIQTNTVCMKTTAVIVLMILK